MKINAQSEQEKLEMITKNAHLALNTVHHVLATFMMDHYMKSALDVTMVSSYLDYLTVLKNVQEDGFLIKHSAGVLNAHVNAKNVRTIEISVLLVKEMLIFSMDNVSLIVKSNLLLNSKLIQTSITLTSLSHMILLD